MENKKNTILLTVIAVATLLVAVVGATFAYFTAQGGGSQSVDVTVKTETTNTAAFGTFSPIVITATESNFYEGAGDQSGTTTGSVTYTAASNEASVKDMCYTAEFDVTTNSFVYSSTNESQAAELTLTVTKNDTALLDAVDITTLAAGTYYVPTSAGSLSTSSVTHTITGVAGETVTENWKVTVTLVNLDVDQNDNAGKSFVGQLVFTQIDC